jgi:hypothetical protein
MIWRAINWLRTAGFLLLIPFVGYCSYLAADREKARANVTGSPAKPAYHACEFFEGTWVLDYLRDRPGRVARRLTTAANPKLESLLPTEDVRVITVRPPIVPSADWRVPVAGFRIPCDFPTGPAYYQVAVTFYNNWFQEAFPVFGVTIEYPAIEFMVLPAKRSGMLSGDQAKPHGK